MDPRIFGNFADQYVRTFRVERDPSRRVYRRRPASTFFPPRRRTDDDSSL